MNIILEGAGPNSHSTDFPSVIDRIAKLVILVELRTQIVRSNTTGDNRVFVFIFRQPLMRTLCITKYWIGYLDGMTGGTTSCGTDWPQRGSVFTTSCETDLPQRGSVFTVISTLPVKDFSGKIWHVIFVQFVGPQKVVSTGNWILIVRMILHFIGVNTGRITLPSSGKNIFPFHAIF